MSISDSLGGALALAGTGIVFAAFATATPAAPFAGVFALTTVIGIAAVAVAPRVARPGHIQDTRLMAVNCKGAPAGRSGRGSGGLLATCSGSDSRAGFLL